MTEPMSITCARCGTRMLSQEENTPENDAMEVCSRCMKELMQNSSSRTIEVESLFDRITVHVPANSQVRELQEGGRTHLFASAGLVSYDRVAVTEPLPDDLLLIEASKVLFKHGAFRSAEGLEQWAARIRGEL